MATILLLSTLLFINSNAKYTYSFQLYVSSQGIYAPSTDDPIWFRLCTTSYNCGKFTKTTGSLSSGNTYNYNYVTINYLGPIGIVQLVHKGSDQVCFGHIKVGSTEYDDGTIPDCLDYGGGSGCEIVTVTLSNNNWAHRDANPCDYESILDDTYAPSPAPTNHPTPAPTAMPSSPTSPPTTSPTSVTNAPSVSPTYPTSAPTSAPTTEPTIEPTFDPTSDPTLEPSMSPTFSPSPAPSARPTKAPTEAPFSSAKVEVSTAPTSAPIQTAGAGISKNEPDEIDYGLILGIVFGVLFCCTLVLFILYCWRNKKKQQDEVNRLNIQAGGVDMGQSIPDASPMSVGDGNPTATTFTQHISQMSDIPQLPAETFAEGGESGTGTGTGTRGAGDGGGTGSNPASMDYDEDEEPVVPYGSVDEADISHDDDEKDDMYEPALAIAAIHDHPNQVTAVGDDEYEYYYEDENGNIIPDNGYGNSPGGDQVDEPDMNEVGSMGIPPVVNDEDSESENEQYEHAEMYNKKRSTANGKENALKLDSDVSDNMYGL